MDRRYFIRIIKLGLGLGRLIVLEEDVRLYRKMWARLSQIIQWDAPGGSHHRILVA